MTTVRSTSRDFVVGRVALVASSLVGLSLSACAAEDDVIARYTTSPEPDEAEGEPRPEPMPDRAPEPGDEPRLLELSGELDVSDSTLIAVGERFYLYQTGDGISTKSSADLLHWEVGPAIFVANPDWIASAVPDATILWAPHVVALGGGHHLYYAVSTFASSRSCIGHAIAERLGGDARAGTWIDRGSVLCSNVDTGADDWNAIDPHVLVSGAEAWMVFGTGGRSAPRRRRSSYHQGAHRWRRRAMCRPGCGSGR